jgi:hypothetical protein
MITPATEYQPRYVAYAAAHGMTPEAMLDWDRIEWPGGRMAGFILWVRQQWHSWAAERGVRLPEFLTQQDHDDFDAWLLAKAGA